MLSFVVCTTGERASFVDECVVPSIAEQAPCAWEVVVAGSYAGRHAGEPYLTVVPAPRGEDLFYKPFQLGVEAARGEWIVDLDDDMMLERGWGDAVGAALPEAVAEPYAILGARMTNPDGSLYGDYFDAVDNRFSSSFRGDETYFSSYVAPRELFMRVPYPTYMSGDRAHVLRIAAAGVAVEKRLLEGAAVMHAGQSRGQRGLVPKTVATTEPPRDRMRALLAALAEHGGAWQRFADKHLDGRPDVRFEDALRWAQEPDPDVRSRGSWLA